MRTWGWFFGLALLLPGAIGSAQEFRWKDVKTPHYLVKTAGDVREAQELGAHLEAVYGLYLQAFGNPEKTGTCTVRLYPTPEDYRRAAPTRPGNSHYAQESREVVGYSGESRSNFALLAGYQFNHAWFGNSYATGAIPPWLDQGITLCLANGEVRNKRFYACLTHGERFRNTFAQLTKAIRDGWAWPLEKMIETETVYLSVAQAASFCHFLLSYPQLGLPRDAEKPLPEGKYSHVLPRLYQDLKDYAKPKSSFKTMKEVYQHAFVTKEGDQPLDFAELNKEWRQHVTDLEAFFASFDKEAEEKFRKAMELAKELKWSEVRKIVEEFNTVYRYTPVFESNRSELAQLAEMAKRGADGKISTNDVILFGGKDIALMKVADIKDNSKAWRVEQKLLIGESDLANLTYSSTTLRNWSLTVTFRCPKDSKGEALFGISSQNKASDVAEPFDRGVWFRPATGELESFDGSGQHPATATKATPAPSKNEWNVLTLTRDWSHVTIQFNQEKVFEYDLDKHDALAGPWSLHIRKGRVIVRSAVLQLR